MVRLKRNSSALVSYSNLPCKRCTEDSTLGLRFEIQPTATYLRQLEGAREVDFIVFQKAPIFVGRVIVPWDGFANSFRVRLHQNAANCVSLGSNWRTPSALMKADTLFPGFWGSNL